MNPRLRSCSRSFRASWRRVALDALCSEVDADDRLVIVRLLRAIFDHSLDERLLAKASEIELSMNIVRDAPTSLLPAMARFDLYHNQGVICVYR
jgi:hypothetical protein